MSIQNNSYDEIDDVISMVNNGFERRRQEQIKREAEFEEKSEKNVTAVASMIDRALERSIKEEDWKIQQQKISNDRNAEYHKKMKTTIIAVLIGASLVAPLAFKSGKALIDRFNHWKDIEVAVAVQSNEIENILKENDLAYEDLEKRQNFENGYSNEISFTVRDNSVQDYKCLNVKDYVDVYLYKNTLPPEEFEDFIKSVSYVDTNGAICNYLNFEQFLRINGFPDERTFINYAQEGAYQRQVQKEQNNQISAGYENTGKGGRS